MNREQILKIWPHASESTIRRNLDVCPVAASVGEPASILPLDQGIQKRQKGKGGVAVVVTLVSCRRRELDDDGNVAALKPLRDAIASSLGLDDGDKRIKFEYGQVETRTKPGVIVRISKI